MAVRKTRPIVFLAVACLLGACSGPAVSSTSAPNRAPAPVGRQGSGGTGAGGQGGAVPGTNAGDAVAGGRPLAARGFAPVVDAAQDPQSTFALDVDTASYSYARTLIDDGQMPDPTAVRPEEFINSIAEDYQQPYGNGFTVSLDGAQLPSTHLVNAARDMRLLRVGLQTRAESSGERPDAALTFVIDVSGSMGNPGKLDLVKDALHNLVDHLRSTDAVAIVTFNGTAHVIEHMTTVSQKSALHSAIGRLQAGGNTNLEAGLVTGYQIARDGFRPDDTNRVVLLSDGLANRGGTEASQILGQVREAADKQITLLGVGVGRDYGDTLMEQLADRGDGFVVYVSDQTRARSVFVEQLPATLALRALDAKAQVTFNPATVSSYRLIGYDDRALADSSFRNDHVDGGEVGAGHTVTALYAVRLQPDAYGQVATADVRWLDPVTRAPSEAADTVYVADLDVPFVDAAPLLRLCYAAAYFAEVLRHSPYGAEVRVRDLARIAADASDQSDDPGANELASTIARADQLG